MPKKIILEIKQGEHEGKEYIFAERTVCLMGRSPECYIKLPSNEAHRTVSRHHCLIDLNPPQGRIRDLGSLNGTFVNDVKIGQRQKEQSPEEAGKERFPEYDLKHGDLIKLGETVFEVTIYIPALCQECREEIPEGEKEKAWLNDETFLCSACRLKAQQPKPQAVPVDPENLATIGYEKKAGPLKPPPPPAPGQVCARCGKSLEQKGKGQGQGETICDACRRRPQDLADNLLKKAKGGKEELSGLEKYTILKELGKGGMGAVYQVRNQVTGQEAALKVMLPKIAADKQASARFLREIELNKGLKHRNVVQMYECGFSDGVFFFTMELCNRGSLDQYLLKKGGRLAGAEALELTFQALDGLDYIHNAIIPSIRLKDGSFVSANGLVHRDLKPGNIFLHETDGRLQAKIADVGFGKAFDLAGLSGLTMTGEGAGTPPFMPRQQLINFKFSKPEVDVWAMAATLYFLLTGCLPRDFPPGCEPWRIILENSAVPILKRNPGIPKRLAEVIDYALIDNPEIKIKTAQALQEALRKALP